MSAPSSTARSTVKSMTARGNVFFTQTWTVDLNRHLPPVSWYGRRFFLPEFLPSNSGFCWPPLEDPYCNSPRLLPPHLHRFVQQELQELVLWNMSPLKYSENIELVTVKKLNQFPLTTGTQLWGAIKKLSSLFEKKKFHALNDRWFFHPRRIIGVSYTNVSYIWIHEINLQFPFNCVWSGDWCLNRHLSPVL